MSFVYQNYMIIANAIGNVVFLDPSVKKVFAEFIAPKQRRLRKSGPSSHKLREDLRQQMGMANLYLAKGQIDEAIEVCMEIIRQGMICYLL